MKKYILIAGVNGAGKSTLYQTLQSLQNIPRVNSDEILKEFGDWRNTKERVASRVLHGGHGIPEGDIEKRYMETFRNLKLIIPDINLTAFYDNTNGFRRFAIYKNGAVVKLSQNVPFWYKEYVEKTDN